MTLCVSNVLMRQALGVTAQLPTKAEIFPACSSSISQHVGVKQSKKHKKVRMPRYGKGVIPLVLPTTRVGGHTLWPQTCFLCFR